MTLGVAIMAIAGLTGVTSANATTAAAQPAKLTWGACPADETVPAGVGCATLPVPLDYAKPDGQQITLTISGIGSLDAPHFMLVNPGGPGAIGLGTEQLVYSHLPADVTSQYAVFSFDPRGTGASTPISCGDTSKLTPHPALPYLPATSRQEQQRISTARQVASQCGTNAKSMLPYLTVDNEARDLDRIRVALGKDKIDYLGYSAGTRLGATYATLFPTHVGRMILDSVVDPTVSTYHTGYEQDPALRNRAMELFAWAATKDATYHLGTTAQAVESTWQSVRSALAAKPAGGRAGIAELDDLLASAMYEDDSWPEAVQAVTDYRAGRPDGLLSATDQLASGDVDAGQLAYNCVDPGWPSDWPTWHADTTAAARTAPLFAWLNTWYSAPCAFWPVPPVQPVRIGSVKVPPVLLLQGNDDAATPLIGAQRMHEVLAGSALLVDAGGNHASYLIDPNPCIDDKAGNYLLTGQLPADGSCPASTSNP
jgi:pimeloyl-ACP methyl ester carboxylesterase